jgi:transposase
VHVKTLRSQKLRMLLTHRKLLQSKAIAIENDLRETLHNFGLKVGMVGTVRFEARIQELVETIPDLMVLVEPLLVVRGRYASRSSSCTAACWPLCETTRCAGA